MSKPKRYELTAEQWRRVGDLLPGKPGDLGRSGTDNLTFVNGVLWVLRSGAHWHDLLSATASGRLFTSASRVGRRLASGSGSSPTSSTIPTTIMSASTRASCAPISRQPPERAAAKKGDQALGVPEED